MIWVGIIDTDIVGPFFFEANVNAESYLRMLGDNVIPALHALGHDPQGIIFQHDGAPAHAAYVVCDYLKENFLSFIGRHGDIYWPPRSPDLSMLDFFLFGNINALVYRPEGPGRLRAQDLDELKARIIHAMQTVTPETLKKVHESLIRRLYKCIAVNGQHIEQFKI